MCLGAGASANASFTCSDEDAPTICSIFTTLGYKTVPRKRNEARCPNYGIHSGFQVKLGAAGLLNNKHIPEQYLHASVSQRLGLVQGLMDTDGSCDKRGLCKFASTNKALADGMVELLTSLGWSPSTCKKRFKLNGDGPAWYISFWADRPVFRLQRKHARQQFGFKKFFPVRYVTDVKKVSTVPVKCITVDSPSSLYLCGKGCISTHNTRLGAMAGWEEAAVPNTIGWACAHTFPKLTRYVIPAFERIVRPEHVLRWDKELGDLWLRNGSLIHFQTLEDPNQARGQGLDWL